MIVVVKSVGVSEWADVRGTRRQHAEPHAEPSRAQINADHFVSDNNKYIVITPQIELKQEHKR